MLSILRILFMLLMIVLIMPGCDSNDDDSSDDGSTGSDDDDDNDDDNDDNDDSEDTCAKGHTILANNQHWTDAKLHLAYGDYLQVNASGQITLEEGGANNDPGGIDEVCGLGCPAPGLNRGALVGKIQAGTKSDGVPFLVDTHYESLVTDAGNLFFIVNDDTFVDNDGHFCAAINVSSDDDDDTYDDDDDDDSVLPSQCQPENYAIQVIDVVYGTTAGFGQPFLPDNVLGPPVGGGDYAPQSNPNTLLSLGEGGYIILKMGREILNEPGIDFIVYENMMYWGGNYYDAYTEAAVVDVSQDGVTWQRFPHDFVIGGPVGPQGLPDTVPDNFIGFAGIIPTYANCDPDNNGYFGDMIDPLDPVAGGGDPFDLEDVGLEWAAYVRIVDTGHIERNPGSEMYDEDGDLINDGGNLLDVWDGIQGFDLDAVAVVHGGVELEPDSI